MILLVCSVLLCSFLFYSVMLLSYTPTSHNRYIAIACHRHGGGESCCNVLFCSVLFCYYRTHVHHTTDTSQSQAIDMAAAGVFYPDGSYKALEAALCGTILAAGGRVYQDVDFKV